MAWNHRTKVVAMGVAIQATAGVFQAPNRTTDLLAVASPTNTHEAITTDDPTATGSVWDAAPARLGLTATVGGTLAFRGPGGSAPPAPNAWPVGRIFQASGYAEIIKPTASTSTTTAGSTPTAINLAATESATDDALLGAPLQMSLFGTGFRATTLIMDYLGGAKTAVLGETLGSAPAAGVSYTIPAYVSYVLGTLTTPPPALSISIWRDAKRYDYRDWRPTNFAFDLPVANDANTALSSANFSGRAVLVGVVDDTTPSLPDAVLNVPVPPIRDGKFYLDRVKLGHQNVTFTLGLTTGAASNQNQAAGQDGYDILSGSRTVSLDLNQMAVTDFDIEARVNGQTTMSTMSMWGLGAGNRFGFGIPSLSLNPLSPGDRNGYVNLSGDAYLNNVDKGAFFTVWWA